MSNKAQYDTLVLEGAKNLNFGAPLFGGSVAAWSAGHALDEKGELEDFVRAVSYGDIEDPQQAALALMERIKWS